MSLENDILQTAQQAIQKSIQDNLTGYSSPLMKLVNEIVGEHTTELRQMINEAFEETIRTEEFAQGLREAFSHKLARTLISDQQGICDKVSGELKKDTLFKAKLTVAIEKVVNEYTNQND